MYQWNLLSDLHCNVGPSVTAADYHLNFCVFEDFVSYADFFKGTLIRVYLKIDCYYLGAPSLRLFYQWAPSFITPCTKFLLKYVSAVK